MTSGEIVVSLAGLRSSLPALLRRRWVGCAGATEQAQPKAAQENNAKSSQAVSKLQKLAASKRGGFGDSGGLTADGDLPRAEPVHIGSDQECKSVLAKLSKDLDLKNDWNDRIKVATLAFPILSFAPAPLCPAPSSELFFLHVLLMLPTWKHSWTWFFHSILSSLD